MERNSISAFNYVVYWTKFEVEFSMQNKTSPPPSTPLGFAIPPLASVDVLAPFAAALPKSGFDGSPGFVSAASVLFATLLATKRCVKHGGQMRTFVVAEQ
jgi:hypothetical protein